MQQHYDLKADIQGNVNLPKGGIVIPPGGMVSISVELGSAETGSIKIHDISRETFGKYQDCTLKCGRWFADEDFGPLGALRWGAIPSPDCIDRRPWYGYLWEGMQRLLRRPRKHTR
jgi:hypothetical protein